MSGFWKPEPVLHNRRLRQQYYNSNEDNNDDGENGDIDYYNDSSINDNNNNDTTNSNTNTKRFRPTSSASATTATSSMNQFHRMLLPIYKHKKQILYAVETYGVVVIVGETGSGKSTQIPQYLVQEGGWAEHDFQVVCTQPRRIAAITLADRVNYEMMGTTTDRVVGYCVRFDDTSIPYTTKIKYVTDGILLREASLYDPLLSKYSVIMIDEAHERTLQTDAVLGMLKMIRKKRPELRLIICSATIDAQAFLQYFTDETLSSKVKSKSSSITSTTSTTITKQQSNSSPESTATESVSKGKYAGRKRPRWDNNDTNSGYSSSRTDTYDTNSSIQQQTSTTTASTTSTRNNIEVSELFLNQGTIISVEGRQYPVDVLQLAEPTSDYIVKMIDVAYDIVVQNRNKNNSKLSSSSDSNSNSNNNNNNNNYSNNHNEDILCFLPSGEQIDSAIRMANERFYPITKDGYLVEFLPLYGNLPYEQQERVFQKTNQRMKLKHQQQHKKQYNRHNSNNNSTTNRSKDDIVTDTTDVPVVRIVFATNIAEASVTVPNVRYVIDSGLVKLPYFDPRTGLERLIVCPISHASAKQRTGRAGRVDSGICYRLYTEKYMNEEMVHHTPPEILRTNITSFILTLKSLCVDNILAFDLIDMPAIDSLVHGLESLYALNGIDDHCNLTPLGTQMAQFPTEPRVSRMLLQSLQEKCSWEILAVASALQVRNLFISLPPSSESSTNQQLIIDYNSARSEYIDPSGDHVTYSNIIADMDTHWYNSKQCTERFLNYTSIQRAIEIRNQLGRFLKKYGRIEAIGLQSNGSSSSRSSSSNFADDRSKAIRKCVTAGFFGNIAKLNNDGRYYTLRNHICVTPSSTSAIFTTNATTTTRGYSKKNTSNFLHLNNNNSSSSEYIIFGETVDGPRGGIELKNVSTIEAQWLRELAPHYWE